MKSHRATDLAAWLEPSRTALLIIDMQADFALPDGAMGGSGADLSRVPDALAASQVLAAAARRAGVAAIFVGLQTTPATDSEAWIERARRLGQDATMGLCRKDEVGATFVGATPEPGDLVFAKTRYSAFFGGELDAQLRSRGLDTLVVCGLTTECCVAAAVRDAYERDYHVFVASDACAAYEPELHRVSLEAMALNSAIVVAADEVFRAWSGRI